MRVSSFAIVVSPYIDVASLTAYDRDSNGSYASGMKFSSQVVPSSQRPLKHPASPSTLHQRDERPTLQPYGSLSSDSAVDSAMETIKANQFSQLNTQLTSPQNPESTFLFSPNPSFDLHSLGPSLDHDISFDPSFGNLNSQCGLNQQPVTVHDAHSQSKSNHAGNEKEIFQSLLEQLADNKSSNGGTDELDLFLNRQGHDRRFDVS